MYVNMSTSAEIPRTANRLFTSINYRTSATESSFMLIDSRPDSGLSHLCLLTVARIADCHPLRFGFFF